MKVYTCFLLFKIIAYAYSEEVQNAPVENDRVVNLALETVLEFDNKDNSADVKFLDGIEHFITRIKSVIKHKNARRLRSEFKTHRVETFTDFMQELVHILNTYDNPVFQEFFNALDQEIRKYHYRGCKFYELTENIEIRRLIGTKLDLIKGKSVFVLRTYINVLSDLIKDESYDDYVKELLDYINSLYRQEDRQKFKQVLSDLEDFNTAKPKSTNRNLARIISDGVRSIIFDHYTDLNSNARRELKYKIETFLKHYKQIASLDSKSNTKPIDVNTVKNDEKYNIRDVKKETTPTHEKEENKREENQHKEHNRDRVKRIEIKDSDYNNKKKSRFVIMRDGFQEQSTPRVKFAKTDNGEKTKFKVPSARKDVEGFQRTTKDNVFSSDEHITDESFESNSIEFFQEKMLEANTQRYMTLYPEELIDKPTTTELDANNIRSAKSSTRRPKVHTLWVDKSTGRLQKAHHDEPRHKPKHDSKNQPKQGWTPRPKYGVKHSEYKSKYKLKKKPEKSEYLKYDKPATIKKNIADSIFSEHRAFLGIKTTNKEFYDDEKMFEPGSIEKHEKAHATEYTIRSVPVRPNPSRPFRATRRARHTTKTAKSTTGVRELEGLVKRYQKLIGKQHTSFRKNNSPNHKEKSAHKKKLDQYKNHKLSRRIFKNETEANMYPNVIKRISNLEEELKEVKSRIDGVDIIKMKAQNVMERSEPKEETEKGIKFVTVDIKDKTSPAKETEVTINKFKPNGTTNTLEYKPLVKFAKGIDSKSDEIKIMKRTEIDDKEKDSKSDEVQAMKRIEIDDKEKDSKSDEVKAMKRIEIDDKGKDSKSDEVKAMKIIEIDDKEKDSKSDEVKAINHVVTQTKTSKVTKMIDSRKLIDIRNTNYIDDMNIQSKETKADAVIKPIYEYQENDVNIKNYDMNDDWKGSKLNTKTSTTSNASKATEPTQNTTVKTTTTEKPTKIATMSTRAEITSQITPVTTTVKPPNLTRKHAEPLLALNYDNMMKDPPELDDYFAQQHATVTNIMDFLKKDKNPINNVTMLTVNENVNTTQSLKRESSQIDLSNRKEFDNSSPPFLRQNSDRTTTDDFHFTDPFAGIGDDLPF